MTPDGWGPLGYEFMQRGFLAALMVGILCSVVGCYVVVKSMAFIGDAVAHAILPGIAVAYLLDVNLTLGASVAGVLVALGIHFLTRHGRLREDTAIGIIFTAALALGVAMISSIRNSAVDLTHILFGNVLGVSNQDLWMTGLLAVVVLGIILVLYRQFLVIAFDPVLAVTLKLPVNRLNLGLMILLSLTVVVSIQTVGVALCAALLVTPPATAAMFTKRFPAMMAVSALIGSMSCLAGLAISFYLNVPSGSAIVLTATAVFLIALVVRRMSHRIPQPVV